MLKVGGELGHAVHDVLSIVSVKTYRRWQREEKGDKDAKKGGRPKIAKSLRDTIIKLAKENVGWGVKRIVGELKKLTLKASGSTVRRVLKEAKILPDPSRHAPKGVDTPWRKFIAAHMNVMVACDFFQKSVWTALGKKMAYVLVFIHLESRRIFMSPSTYTPTAAWMQQQARNVSMWADEQGIDIRFLIHDRDTKFTKAFNEHFKRDREDDVRAILTPVGAPNANPYSESVVGKLKAECLNHFFCFSLRQLDYICQNFGEYYNNFRPHQSLGNRIPNSQPPDAQADPPQLDTEVNIKLIKRKSWLGGLLRHYERQAA